MSDIAEASRSKTLLRLFIEFFKISLFVIGGGYAIIIAADDTFGKRLKWTKEGEILAHLPIFQSVPGLLAGNTAIFVGMKTAGIIGAFVGLVAIAIPSIVIITAIAMGFQWLPLDNMFVNGAFLGLRSSLCGIVLAALIKSWKKTINGFYSYLMMPIFCIAIIIYKVNPIHIILGSAVFGVAYLGIILPLMRKKLVKEEANA